MVSALSVRFRKRAKSGISSCLCWVHGDGIPYLVGSVQPVTMLRASALSTFRCVGATCLAVVVGGSSLVVVLSILCVA
jgi:hypothetical protein